MNALGIVIAVILILIAAVLPDDSDKNNSDRDNRKTAVQPVITIIKPTEHTTPITATPTFRPIPTNIPKPTASLIPNNNSDMSDLTAYYYPGSQLIDQSSGTLILISTDSPAGVTDWYESKFRQSGFNINTFVRTSANGRVLNKLSVSDGTKVIGVEISNKNENTEIRVTQTR